MTRLVLRSPVFDSGILDFSPAQMPVVLGRSRDADITINDGQLSRRHAEICFSAEGQFVIIDLESTNLTIVNERDVTSHVLRTGDQVLLGDTEILIEIVTPDADPNEITTRELNLLPHDKTSDGSPGNS